MKPIIGFRNLLNQGETSATSEITDHQLAFDGLTYDAWSFAGGVQYLNLVLDSPEVVDYFAFGRHSLHTAAGRIRLEGSADGETWVPVTDWNEPDGRAKLELFDTVSHAYFRVAVDSAHGASIGAVHFGRRLVLFNGVGAGFVPPMQARNTRIVGVNSQGGQSLGRSLVGRAVRFPLFSKNYEQEWMLEHGQEFIEHAESMGFFFAFDLDRHPDDVVFVEAEEIENPALDGSFRQVINATCAGTRDEGGRVPDQVQGLSVTPQGNDLVLSWDTVTGAEWYNVYRSESQSGTYTLIGSPDSNGFTDPDLESFKTFWYKVSAVNAAGVGPESEAVSGKTDLVWESAQNSVRALWQAVAWSPDLEIFVAVGQQEVGSNFATSTDGHTWIGGNSPASSSVRWQGVTWSPSLGLFAAVAQDGEIMTSPDGTTWTLRTGPVGMDWQAVEWSAGLGLFIAVGIGDTVATSSDGITWTGNSAPNNSWVDVKWSPSLELLVAISPVNDRVMTSSNGTTWSTISVSDTQPQSLVWAGGLGLFITVGGTGSSENVLTSPDGVNWTVRTVPVSNLRSIAWSEDKGVAVALMDSLFASGEQIWVTQDGVSWFSQVSPQRSAWTAIAYGTSILSFAGVASDEGEDVGAEWAMVGK